MLYLSGVVRPDLPAMVTPRMRQSPPADQPWAADNGRFASPADYADDLYLAWLDSLAEHRDRCLFATAPDVVGDAAATLELSLPMLGPIRAARYPVALVAQDGLEPSDVPWGAIDALFIGGTTGWKLSESAYRLVAESKARGRWTHMGRVNSERRFRAALAAGCDSADGTFLRYGPDANRGRLDVWLAAAATERGLGL